MNKPLLPITGLVALPHEQVRGLLTLLGNAKTFLSTVETADRETATKRDSLIGDCEQWRDSLLRRLDSPAHQPTGDE
jgi:hypothetical protein